MRNFKILILLLIALPVMIQAQTLISGPFSGPIKGTTLPNKTYVITDSITVNMNDTLRISPGDTLIMNSPNGAIFIFGNFFCEGTSNNPIVITVPPERRTLGPGQWGGIVGDSCKIFSMKFTKILWAGGTDLSGHAYRTIDIYSDYLNNTTTTFTDNTVIGTVDDCIGLHGGKASILRNTIKWCGAPDGDNINVKSGTWGEIAYNIIWASGGNGIKINSDKNGLTRLTNMCVHNNTIVAGGWRRITELGYGILVDVNARAEIYNNIIGDNYEELEITLKADTAHIVYDNNLFFGSADSLSAMDVFFAPDGVARAQAHDIFLGHAGSPFVRYNSFFTTDWNTLDSNNDYHLAAACANKGFTPPSSWTNPAISGQLPGDANVGALGTTTAVHQYFTNDPVSFSLKQNYPNPFNPSTTIEYILPHDASVSLKVFNIEGQLVRTLVNNEAQIAGTHTVRFDAANLPSGVYIYKLQSATMSDVVRMVLLK